MLVFMSLDPDPLCTLVFCGNSRDESTAEWKMLWAQAGTKDGKSPGLGTWPCLEWKDWHPLFIIKQHSEEEVGQGKSEILARRAAVASFRPGVLKLERQSESPGRLVQPQIARSTPGVSDSAGLGFGPKNLHFLKFPGDANAVSLSTTLYHYFRLIPIPCSHESCGQLPR